MLIEKDGQWQFESEATFERLLWQNLEEWLSFQPLARQLRMCSEPCDIIARSPKGKPVILELKNEEDRYVVQQLTRYYHNFLEERPDLPNLDSSESPQLVAIAPSLHRHNFIDRLYHRLNVELWTFQIRKQDDQFLLELVSWESPDTKSTIKTINLTPHIQPPAIAKPDPLSQLDKNWKLILSKRPRMDQKHLLEIRDRVLSFSPKLGEVVTTNTATYGQMRSKTSLCESHDRLCICLERFSKPELPRIGVYLPFFVGLALRSVKVTIVFEDWENVCYLKFPRRCNSRNLQHCHIAEYGNAHHYLENHRRSNDYNLSTQAYLSFYKVVFHSVNLPDHLNKINEPSNIDQQLGLFEGGDARESKNLGDIQSHHSLMEIIDLSLFDWQRRQERLSAKRRPSPSAE